VSRGIQKRIDKISEIREREVEAPSEEKNAGGELELEGGLDPLTEETLSRRKLIRFSHGETKEKKGDECCEGAHATEGGVWVTDRA